MFGRFAAALTICLLFTNQVNACSVPPQELTRHHTDLVQDTESIVLAKAIGPSEQFGDLLTGQVRLAQFVTLEVIKGSAPPTFTIDNGFFRRENSVEAHDFDGHSELAFWERDRTRQWNMPDCQMYPVFLQDRTYLLFLGTQHWRGYEEIVVNDDLWLEAVRKLSENPDLETGLSIEPEQWFSMAEGVFQGAVANCFGPTLTVENEFLGSFEGEWSYSDSENSRYWPAAKCIEGEEFVVVTIAEELSPLPYYNSILFPVIDGSIDLSMRGRSEIEIGQSFVNLDEVAGYFRN